MNNANNHSGVLIKLFINFTSGGILFIITFSINNPEKWDSPDNIANKTPNQYNSNLKHFLNLKS
jgi:hypothetical protein